MKAIRMTLKPIGKPSLPQAHFDILQGIFYHLLSIDKELSTEIHNKESGRDKQFKFFCFTDLHGKSKISKNRIFYDGYCKWEIRSADDRIINTIVKAVDYSKSIVLDDGMFKIISYSFSEMEFLDKEAIIVLDTPVTIYKTDEYKHVTYYSPLDEEFVSGIISNIKNKINAYYGTDKEVDVKITCFSKNEDCKCVTYYKNYVITAHYGRFRIEAEPDVLKFIFYTGLGAKNIMGFGTINLIGQKP